MSTPMEPAVMDGEGPALKIRRREPALMGRPLASCPGCGSRQLRPVVDADVSSVHFLCGSCSRCWRVELGYVHRVQPATCDGCPQAAQCAASWAQDHAST